ncbi:MAG: glycosyltransferase family 2 protein [Verrucomicrobia bacterium]|nr:glycosyltransferase family 2 protein [Verrucomicrobiota bacterium]
MVLNKKVVVVMPAYNAEKTLLQTYQEVRNQACVDQVILVDDCSRDRTFQLARTLDEIIVHKHDRNLGYGANQKSCYRLALKHRADIVIMLHPDYQYTPQLIPAMAHLVACGLYHCVLGSRILGGYALKGNMPIWKYISNRALTAIQNLLIQAKLSEYHTGFRAFSRQLLQRLQWQEFSDDFLFDNQFLAQTHWFGYQIAEITCPTKYFPEASSINFKSSVRYGCGCLMTSVAFRLAKLQLTALPLFPSNPPDEDEIRKAVS